MTAVSAKLVVVAVGHNSTDNPSAVFDPPTITANRGDVVYFNCMFLALFLLDYTPSNDLSATLVTQGNHTVTQSIFAAPCMRAHDFNQTLNGFDSGFRNAGNYNAITNLQIPVEDPSTIWYFDWNTCNVGGVGAINVNESSFETYDGFVVSFSFFSELVFKNVPRQVEF